MPDTRRLQSVKIKADGRHSLILSHIMKDDQAGFSLCGHLEDVGWGSRSYCEPPDLKASFDAFGQFWELELREQGPALWVGAGPSHPNTEVELTLGQEPFRYTAYKACESIKANDGVRGTWQAPTEPHLHWLKPATAFEALRAPPFLDLLGNLHVSLTVLFAGSAGRRP